MRSGVFLTNFEVFDMYLSSVFDIFSIETKTKEKTEE